VLPAELAGDLAAATAPAAPRPSAGEAGEQAPLTPRELEVLALLAEGLPNKAIGPRLGISEHTVKAHVTAIFAKLHAGTRAEAVVTAARRGLLML
jgi:DNA-binding NarL/FixJ family response regulator